MKSKKLFLLVIFLVAVIGFIAYAYNLPKLFKFDRKDALSEWQEKIFRNRVLYIVEPQTDGGQLVAKSKNACSGLLYKIRFDSKKYPMISWKWKVIKFPEKSSSAGAASIAKKISFWDKLLVVFGLQPSPKKPESVPLPEAGKNKNGWLEKDDYAARIYVIFPSWIFTNIKTIEYVWSEDLPKGTIMTSPYFANIKLVVVESGKKNNSEWVYEERNIYEDYKRAFGGTPPGVGAIALMTDTDNTLSTAEALYTDIKVGYEK
ncbi:MAG: DUF3047 domain-containing protein [Candidatus Omnitrophica bacterium]|jgi:hypothetical protein|nr:DUF3047 domain-containing protein [Candidatus Omnitrophota bacterium]